MHLMQQQQQQSNAHLAAQAKLYSQHQQQHHHDYRATQQSPANVFQSHPQYHSLASNFAQVNAAAHHHQQQGPPPLHVKPLGNHHGGGGAGGGHYNVSEEQANLLREQMYQSSGGRGRQNQQMQQQPLIRQQPVGHQQPVTELQQQYQQLHQAKMQAQMKTQNEAFMQQQRTFAMRQHLNPPVPNAQLHQMQSQQQSMASIPMHLQSQSQQQQQANRSVPPSSLNLTNQFQPANGPMTIMNNNNNNNIHESQYGTNNAQLNHHVHYHPQSQQQQQHYMHQQQSTASTPDQIIIQQNHPGLVTNQACQTQISGQVHRNKQQPQQQPQIASPGNNSVQTTPSSDSTPSSPAHALLDRKKSAGSIALKSPMSKRPANSPITLTGWLYKQGSDGLKVWRKRWFVLSQFCLYYYKGPEEEKLLGSVLLPSYRVAACTPDDKIYRKFAFKCEHVNMRTYWLAAETAEVMGQWVRALTAATTMQGSSTSSSDQMSQPSVSSLNHSAENSDSGIHTYQSNKLNVVTNGSGGSGTTPASISENGGGPQPLYANAPPKPRRATDGGYSSPSPEHSMDRFDASYDSRHLEVSTGNQRGDVKSPNPMNDPLYEVRCQLAKSNDPELAARMQQQLRLDYNKSPGVAQQQTMGNAYNPESGYGGANVEDIYQMRMGGRNQLRTASSENILKQHQLHTMNNTNTYPDRNELMREKELYLQRLAAEQQQQQMLMGGQPSVLYPNNDRRTPDTYGRSRSGGPSQSSAQMGRLSTTQEQKRVFSDYEDIYNMENPNPELLGAYQRPMSPLSNQVAGYFEGSEMSPSQAQQIKMRSRPSPSSAAARPHSADFLEYEARNPRVGPTPPTKPQAPRPKSSLDINRTPDNYYYSEENYAEKLRQSAMLKQRPGVAAPPTQHPVPGQDYQQDMIDYERKYYSGSNGHQSRSDYMSPQQEQFLRSASARLPRVPRDDDRTMVMTGRDGERKREESMKRLLEWKQRMLQSPLTRKGGNNVSTVPDRPKSAVHMTQGLLQRSRSETNANQGYNSYSSDDEGTCR